MAKQEIADKHVEYKYKQDKIENLGGVQRCYSRDRTQKKILEFMQEEWNSMPKDTNRN